MEIEEYGEWVEMSVTELLEVFKELLPTDSEPLPEGVMFHESGELLDAQSEVQPSLLAIEAEGETKDQPLDLTE